MPEDASSTFDLVVIGAGPGGYVAAIRAPSSACKSPASTSAIRSAAPASTSAASRPRRCSTRPSVFYEAEHDFAKHGIKRPATSTVDLAVDDRAARTTS